MLRDDIDRRESTATIRRARNAGLDPDMVLERIFLYKHVLGEPFGWLHDLERAS